MQHTMKGILFRKSKKIQELGKLNEELRVELDELDKKNKDLDEELYELVEYVDLIEPAFTNEYDITRQKEKENKIQDKINKAIKLHCNSCSIKDKISKLQINKAIKLHCNSCRRIEYSNIFGESDLENIKKTIVLTSKLDYIPDINTKNTTYKKFIKTDLLKVTEVNNKNKIICFKTEKHLEEFIINNLDIIEDDLQFVDNQVKTEDGIIDIIARDKNHTLCIIELKNNDNDKHLIEQSVLYPTQFQESSRMITLCPGYSPKIYKCLKSLGNVEIIQINILKDRSNLFVTIKKEHP